MEETPISLLTNCKLIVCDKISSEDKKLNTFLTDTLQFKITRVDPLVIEKDSLSSDDLNKLLDALKASLYSHNRKDNKLVEYDRESLELKQRESNIAYDSSMQKSSLQAADENRQVTEHKLENNCGDNCSYEVSSQAQGSNDAEFDLVKIFQNLNVNDVLNGYNPGHEKNEIENNLSGNKVCQEHTKIPLGNENVALVENVRSTEKLEQNSQAKCESKKQVEETQQGYLRKQNSVSEHDSESMHKLQNTSAATENELKCRTNNEKQDSQYLEHSSNNKGKVSTDIEEVDVTKTNLPVTERNYSSQATNVSREVNKQVNEEEKNNNCKSISTCRKTTGHVQCEDSESTNKKIIMSQSLTTLRHESLSEKNNATDLIDSEERKIKNALKLKESGRQSMIDKQVHNQNVNTDQESCGILKTNTNRTDMNCSKKANERQPLVVSEDTKINKDMNMQMHEEDKNENHNMSSDSACIQTTDTTKESLNCKKNAGNNQLNHCPHSAVNKEVDKQLLDERKHENSRMSTRKIASEQSVDTVEGRVHLPPSAQNVHQSLDNDMAKQEHSSKQTVFTGANKLTSLLEDDGGESKIDKQRELKPSEISSSLKSQENTDSSDSDAESQDYIKYSMKASSLDGLKMYFKDSIYDKYFAEANNEGTSFIFSLNSSDKNAVSFLNKLKKLKVEECEFDHKDKKYLQSAVKKIEAQIDGLVIQVNDSKVEIVGLKDSVTSARKKLFSLLSNHDLKTNQLLDKLKNDESTATKGESLGKNSPITQRNQQTSRNENSDDEKTHQLGRFSESEYETQLKEPQSERSTHDFPSHSSSLPVRTNYFGDSEGNKFSKNNSNYYVRNEKRTFKVNILKTDITKLKVDCIVNAASKRLQHAGGVAKAISSAAGPALKQECEAFIVAGNQVAVTDIFISTGGNLPAKCVMHAVGPKWEAYDDNSKAQCCEDLRRTVIRCLVEADRQGFTSIAFPSISAAIFKVPKEACARCYMEAVKHFSTFNKEQTSLCEIFFVDVDEAMVKVIKEHFEKNWTNPCDSYIVQKDCDFASKHFYSTTRNSAKSNEKSMDTNKLTSSSVSTKTRGASKSFDSGGRLPSDNTASSTLEKRKEESLVYQIGKFILHTDSKPAFNHSADITVTIGKPFDKLSGLDDFSMSSNKKKGEALKNKFKLFSVSKQKGVQQKQVCALLPEPENADKIKEAIGNLDTIMQSPNHKIFAQNIRKVVLTSRILYKEPDNVQSKKTETENSYDRKKAGDFARFLFEYLKHTSEIANISITVVGCEDALQSIHKVMESRKVKKISPEVQHGARSKTREGSQYHHQGGISGQHSSYAGEGSDHTRHHCEEVQQGARSKTREGSEHQYQGGYSEHSGHAGQGSDYTRQHHEKDVGSSVDLDNTCEICYSGTTLYPVRCCHKFICQDCQQRVSSCPFCRTFWRVSIGNQPPGTMAVHIRHDYADGYEHVGVWEIVYTFPSGVQKEYHPNPGKSYRGISRRAFLPATPEGLLVLSLLRLAFLRKLTFTIGHSLTMDKEDSIIWNDIHHKTNLHGGMHGYPDLNYLRNVRQELANKGVTFDTLSAEERQNIQYFELSIQRFGYFIDV